MDWFIHSRLVFTQKRIQKEKRECKCKCKREKTNKRNRARIESNRTERMNNHRPRSNTACRNSDRRGRQGRRNPLHWSNLFRGSRWSRVSTITSLLAAWSVGYPWLYQPVVRGTNATEFSICARPTTNAGRCNKTDCFLKGVYYTSKCLYYRTVRS